MNKTINMTVYFSYSWTNKTLDSSYAKTNMTVYSSYSWTKKILDSSYS